MQIQFNKQEIRLYPKQEEKILQKVQHLTKLASRLTDEASYARVDLAYHPKARRAQDAYSCHITFFVPHGTLRAEAHADKIETAVDEVIGKLKTQIERYKAKFSR